MGKPVLLVTRLLPEAIQGRAVRQFVQNVVLLPHLGTATMETRNAIGHLALDGIEAVLAGRTPANLVPEPAPSVLPMRVQANAPTPIHAA